MLKAPTRSMQSQLQSDTILLNTQAASPSGAVPSGNATCTFSGGDVTSAIPLHFLMPRLKLILSDYLSCEKGKVSTTTLIAAALGVTVGVLALVGLCVYMCHRSRRVQRQRKQSGLKQNLEVKVQDHLYPYHDEKVPPLPTKVYTTSPEELIDPHLKYERPPRGAVPKYIPAEQFGPSHQKQHPDSPVEMSNGRMLYPSNPIPSPSTSTTIHRKTSTSSYATTDIYALPAHAHADSTNPPISEHAGQAYEPSLESHVHGSSTSSSV